MTKKPDNISADQAKSALEQIAQLDKNANRLIRPPFWLTTIIATLYGLMTFSWASTRHENLWMLGFISSTIGFLLAIAFYLYTSRLLGVRPKMMPKNKTECFFAVLAALLFGSVFIITRVLSINGFEIAVFVGAATNAFVLAYLLQKYSVGYTKDGIPHA